jgi:general secretion pathway protein L
MAGKVPSAFENAWRWWTGELRALLPRRPAGAARTGPYLVLSVDGDGIDVIAERSGRGEKLSRIPPLEEDGAAALASILAARRGQPVGVRFSSRSCFGRTVELPLQAESDYARILSLDLERTTPFRAADVLSAHYGLPGQVSARGKTALRHVIVKRRTIDPLLEALRMQGIEPAFADCWDEDGRRPQPLDFLATTRMEKQPRRNFMPALAVTLVLLAALAASILVVRHQSALDALTALTDEARARAATVRQRVEAAQAASAQIAAMNGLLRARLPATRIIEELTALLPDSAYVSDLRIDGDLVEFTGFAKSAESLVPLLTRSPLFAEAGLTSPVVLDNNEDKERFSIRLRLKDGMPSGATEGAGEGEARL